MSRFSMASMLFALGLPVATAAAPIGFTLGNGGTTLVMLGNVYANAPPSSLAITDSLTGAPVALSDIDFELETRELYGASPANNAIYAIDPTTGVATSRGALPVFSTAPALVIDWNNTVDRLRVISAEEVNGEDFNFVFNQTNNTVMQFTSLFFGAGDPSEGSDPLIIGNAYRDAVANGGAPTSQGAIQLAIDAETNALLTVANNAGVLSTVGRFSMDIAGPGGFDIYSVADGLGGFDDFGYALLTSPQTGATGLFEIALTADTQGLIAATLLRDFGANADLRGLAIIDSSLLPSSPPAPVPLPASFALLAGAATGLFAMRRRRQAN